MYSCQNILLFASFMCFSIALMVYYQVPNKEAFSNSLKKQKLDFSNFKNYRIGNKSIPYTFDDPKKYSGPIYIGWGPEKSRDMKLYIKPTEYNIVSNISCLNLSDTEVLIFVQSAPSLYNRRQANRNSWMKDLKKYPKVKVMNIFGVQSPRNSSSEKKIREEVEKFCDVVQFDFIDTYANITLDTFSVMKFALAWKWIPKSPDFLIIADDDTYINLPEVMKMLYKEDDYKDLKDSDELVGWVGRNGAVLRPFPRDKSCNSASIPTYLMKENIYEPYLSGCFYIMPFKTVECVYATGLDLPLFPMNDVLVGYAATKCGYGFVNEHRVDSTGYVSTMEGDNRKYHLLASHRRSDGMKIKLYQLYSNLSSIEFNKTL